MDYNNGTPTALEITDKHFKNEK